MAEQIDLIETCGACPEQYDAYHGAKRVGYLRLRHGCFTVQCPDVNGEEVYNAAPRGDGCFQADEREHYLAKAKEAILVWLGLSRPAPPRAALEAAEKALQLALDRELGNLADDMTPESGARVEAECPHGLDIDACPWSDSHYAIRQYRAALALLKEGKETDG